MISVLLFYTSYASLLLLGIFRNPMYLVFLYQVVYFFNPAQRWWASLVPDLSYSFYASITLVIFTFFHWGNSRNKLKTARPLKLLIIYGALYASVYFIAIDKDTHLQYAEYLIKSIVIAICIYKLIDSQKKLLYSVYAYILGSSYIGYYIYQVGRNSGDRVSGVGLVDAPTANTVAAALVPSIPILLCFFLKEKTAPKKLAWGVLLGITANALVLINSRGSFLGVICSVSFFTYYFVNLQKTFSQRSKTVIAILLMSILGTSIIVDQGFVDRMMSLKEMGTEVNYEQESGNTRIEFWKASYRMSLDYPLGMGFRGFVIYSPHYLPENLDTGNSRNRAIHSTWFEVLNETGYLGVIIFIFMTISAWKYYSKTISYLKGSGNESHYLFVLSLLSGFLGFLVTASFINRLRAEVLILFITYAVIAFNVYKKSDEK